MTSLKNKYDPRGVSLQGKCELSRNFFLKASPREETLGTRYGHKRNTSHCEKFFMRYFLPEKFVLTHGNLKPPKVLLPPA